MHWPFDHIRFPIWILILILIQSSVVVISQTNQVPLRHDDVAFEHLGEDQGINNHISAIFEDHLGYIWFACGYEGLYRYDGYEFEFYEHQLDDSTSLPHNLVADIFHEDLAGNLWFPAGGLITRYNRATDDFSRFTTFGIPVDGIGFDTWMDIGSVSSDKQGNVWLGSFGFFNDPLAGGLIKWDANSDRFILFQNDPDEPTSLASNCIYDLYTDSKGNLWVIHWWSGIDRMVRADPDQGASFIHYRNRLEDPEDSIRTNTAEILEDTHSLWFGMHGGGLLRYNKELDIFRRYWIDQDPQHPKNRVNAISQDKRGQIWIGTDNGMARYDPSVDGIIVNEGDMKNLTTLNGRAIEDVEIGKDGVIWIITREGSGDKELIQYIPETDQFRTFTRQKYNPESLSSNQLNGMIVDSKGILWVATTNGGINKFDPLKRKFNQLPLDLSGRDDVVTIQALLKDQDENLWIGTFGAGLYRYDMKAGTMHHISPASRNPEGIKSQFIWSIIEEEPDILWIGGDSGLNRLDTRTMESRHFWIDPSRHGYFGPNYIRDLCFGPTGALWIATMGGGLYSFDKTSGEFKSHRQSETNPGGMHSPGLMTVMADESGTIWGGSTGGLDRYTPGKEGEPDSNIYYWETGNGPKNIGSSMVGEMVKDDAGYLWVATSGGGLNRLDPESGKFKQYTTKEGMLSNTITNVVMDNQGYLWVSSFRGLEKFDPGTGECISYDKSDGLLTLEFTQGAVFKSQTGHIYLAGPGGITYFHPDSLTMNRQVPGVVITNMYLFDNPLSLDLTQHIELRHNENFLTFEFAALNFTNSQKNQYRYRMIGLDPDTVEAGSRRTASYTDIKPGTYTFWVTGSNNDGIWNPLGKSMEITIRPPWSRSGLAIGLYVLLFITAVMGIIRWRTWKLVNDRKVLEKQVKERTRVIEEKDRHILEMDRVKTRFFANISHEFRTPLTLILSPLEEIISRRKKGDPELRKLRVIRRNGQRLLNLVNQLLELSKLDSGKLKLELQKADVVRNLRLICSSFISLAEKNRIRYSFRLPDREYITYFDAGKMETILNNLLSNAFKYTPKEGIIECYGRIEENGSSEESNKTPGESIGPAHLSISVIDSGPGISPEMHEHIFTRFYQGDEQYQIEGGGTGIGLSLTKELVELIHGEISVNSEPGEGSCFVVRIPLGKEHLKETEYVIKEENEEEEILESYIPLVSDHTEETAEGPEEGELPLKEHIHLLIVEDNHDLRLYLKEQLQSQYTVFEVAAGDKGLKQALRLIPDLIITDVMMPGMDGIELCKRLKSNEQTSHIPVIMLTAKADFNSRITGLETGADDYILKPFQIKELRTRVHNLIRQRNMLRERFSGNMDKITSDITLNSYDVKFFRRVTEVVEDHLSDFEFDVKKLQEKVGMSHPQLYRKLHALTGYSPSRFIRHLRLKRAEKLLEQQKGSVTHVAFEVGFGNLSYFTKCFKEEFGISPSEYSRQYE